MTSNCEQSIGFIDGLYSYAMILTHRHAVAEDIVQEVNRAVGSTLNGWTVRGVKLHMFVALRSMWLNHAQTYNQIPPHFMPVDICAPNSAVPTECSNQSYTKYMCVPVAIMQLPLDLCEVIILREYEEMSYQEISD